MTRIKTVRERTSVRSRLAGIVAVVAPPRDLYEDGLVRGIDRLHLLLGRADARASVPRRIPGWRKLAAGPRGDGLGRPCSEFGESWHNGHHAFPASAVHGLEPGRLDVSALVIRGMEKLRLATEVRRPDSEQIERRRVAAAGGLHGTNA